MSWFARVVSHHPYVVLLAVAVFSTTCVIISLTTIKLPNFSDPQLGFESRGTVIAQRLTAWENLIEETKPSGLLTMNPSASPPFRKFPLVHSKEVDMPKSSVLESKSFDKPRSSNDVTSFKDTNSQLNLSWIIEIDPRNDSELSIEDEEWKSLVNPYIEDEHLHSFHNHLSDDGYFCGSPNPDYSRLVLKAKDGSDLFTLDAMLEMCQVEMELVSGEQFLHVCETVSSHRCCLPWSLPNYIALLNNRSSCLNITNEDLNFTRSLLELCTDFYYDLKLVPDFENKEVPEQCRRHNAVYNIIHFLVDTAFLPPHNGSKALHYAAVFLPMARSTATLKYYHSLRSSQLVSKNIVVSGIEFGLKNTVFDECLLKDTWLIGLGAVFVLLCMWLYTGSLFITLTTIVAIIFSLGISYFIYTLIFELHFFPFMNLLASIVAVGIGADDAFILCKVWQCSKIENSNMTLPRLVQSSLKHSALSMLVTTLTTAAAFYSSYISTITAIRCFSVFAGTAVMANFALMVTWLPACVVISEQVCWPTLLSLPPLLQPPYTAWHHISSTLHSFLLTSVIRLRYLWILLFGSIAIASIFIVFYWPKLKLPDSADFQLFTSSHPFEQYDLVFRNKFWFERLQKAGDDSWDNPSVKLPLRFVWGILPYDTGDYMDPASRGKLQFDKQFDIAEQESQVWLLKFCRRLRAQPFYQKTSGPLLPNCFMESFVDWMNRRCTDPIDNISREPCCENSEFPFTRRVFNQCVVKAIDSLYHTPAELFMPGVAGPKFGRTKNPRIKAVVVEYDSNFPHSTSFVAMDSFYRQVETWTKDEMKKAPPVMQNGWFISQLAFYDLQKTLAKDTVSAIIVSMMVSLTVLLLVTLNVLISLYAIINISSIIFVTVAILVLIGWKLNVLESIAICVAIGLAVDFSLHYAVNYRMCPDNDSRESSVSYSLSLMAGPTAMAALTTGAAGAMMLPSTILAYIQIGVFLIIVMVVSWFYSTYFLLSLLAAFGPERGYGQYSYPKFCSKKNRGPRAGGGLDRSNKTIYTNVLSESTLSTSSTMCALHMLNNESHELDALSRQTRHSRRLRRSGSLCQSSACHPPRTPRKVSLPADQSPSAASATTIIHDDEFEIMILPGSHVS